MIPKETAVVMCGSKPIAAGSRPHKCSRCGDTVYTSPEMRKSLEQSKALEIKYICVNCGGALLSKTQLPLKIQPLTEGQVEELKAHFMGGMQN